MPLIPPTGRMAGRGGGRGRPAPVPLPLAVPPDSPAPPSELVYGMGRVDASGRVGDRDVMRAMGWQAGEMLTVTAAHGVVLARRDPAGLIRVGGSPHLTIPMALRRRCGLEPGSQVLLIGHLMRRCWRPARWPSSIRRSERSCHSPRVKAVHCDRSQPRRSPAGRCRGGAAAAGPDGHHTRRPGRRRIAEPRGAAHDGVPVRIV